MIEAVIAQVPASLATFGGRIAAGPSRPGARSLSTLRARAAFDAVINAFGEPFGPVDRRAVVSLWTQSYLAALIIPYFTALSRLGQALPIAFDRTGFECDETGTVSRFLLFDADRPPAGSEAALVPLVDGHLRPFFDLCHAHSGLSRRVLWGNAGVAADVTLHALNLDAGLAAPIAAQAQACLSRCDADAFDRCPLAQAFAAGERRRRVCCMRYRLPGVASCGGACPIDHSKAPC
ncbi:siderophore-iron reductase FhuF [Methylobacterium sp. HMF5984]|uniref:siderophore-iron reductase FhuF n=1 Tax=Methylobacterium sp. HMF5984 TaxID=3367370 RepID=UPI0038554A1A